MKATLKPEEERIVTPGARAVEDLLNLPPPKRGVELLDADMVNIGGKNIYIDEVCREKHASLSVAKDIARDTSGLAIVAEELHWSRVLGLPGTFLPSAPLYLAIMRTLTMSSNPTYVDLLKNMRDVSYNTLLDTRIDWIGGTVHHYHSVGRGLPKPKKYSMDFKEVGLKGCHPLSQVDRDRNAYQLLHHTFGTWNIAMFRELFQVDNVIVQFPDSPTPWTMPRISRRSTDVLIDLTPLTVYSGYARRIKST